MVEEMFVEPGKIFGLLILFAVIAIWEVIWKGIGLWKSAQRKQKVWFIFILLINTVGILPIIYLLINRNSKKKRK